MSNALFHKIKLLQFVFQIWSRSQSPQMIIMFQGLSCQRSSYTDVKSETLSL